ncbi:hypothetical protein TRFO_09760 [Tritrichomonas foetus]|uniref:Uncharacterized protein n=1 Tax=Tritrichomonas foetus TaxID=1144522 RepID=A0A1J4JDX6_9EUKA|nr:hypothetical protein TRFO_09760 [Tritrichomonas foetus]|eukprot:OHS96857.1 hypothetical protein TRFO_09760 [Tritrichomonas foetus]
MSIVCQALSKVRGYIYAFQSHPFVKFYASGCVYLEPVTLLFSSFVIVDFFYRVAKGYRYYHKSAQQKVNTFNLLLTFAPIIISAMFIFTEEGISSCLFGFTFVSDALSILYPIVVQRKGHIIGSFFQVTLLFGSLYHYKFQYIYYFLLAIPFAFIVFKNETTQIDRFRRFVIAPYLVCSFLGIIFSYDDKSTVSSAIGIFGGAFIAMIFSD